MNQQETRKAVLGFLNRGWETGKGAWEWRDLAAAVINHEKIDVGTRQKEACIFAEKALNGAYKMNSKEWNDKKGKWTELEVNHIINLAKFEIEFTVKYRPETITQAKEEKKPEVPKAPPPPAPEPPKNVQKPEVPKDVPQISGKEGPRPQMKPAVPQPSIKMGK